MSGRGSGTGPIGGGGGLRAANSSAGAQEALRVAQALTGSGGVAALEELIPSKGNSVMLYYNEKGQEGSDPYYVKITNLGPKGYEFDDGDYYSDQMTAIEVLSKLRRNIKEVSLEDITLKAPKKRR